MCAPSRAPGTAWMPCSHCTSPPCGQTQAALEQEDRSADAATGTVSLDVLRGPEPDRSASGHIGALTALQPRHPPTVPPRAGDELRARGGRALDLCSVLD